MSDHPSFEDLSAFFDGENTESHIHTHLDACADCKAVLTSMEADRAAMRSVWTAPAMPPGLTESLVAAIPKATPWWQRVLFEFRDSLRIQAAAVATAACVAVLLWGRGAGWFSPRVEIPSDLFVAAHNQYELTLPLAPTERIMTEMPRGLAMSIDPNREKDKDVY